MLKNIVIVNDWASIEGGGIAKNYGLCQQTP